jgi:hypothetical protein
MGRVKKQSYETKRNRLIPIAENNVKNTTGLLSGEKGWAREFIREMDRLAVEVGIQDHRYHK